MIKRIISMILSTVVTICCSISVFAYSDVDNESVALLTELKVLSGYEDGTFKPDNLLSRAEFSKIIAFVSSGADTEELSDFSLYENKFSDVPANHWAYSYIMYCDSLKFLEGYEDGSFKPDENVKLVEAIKICLTMIGYNVMVTEDGDDWTKPWLELAYEYGISDIIDDNPDREITRLEAVELVSRTLNMPLCKVTGWDFSSTPPVVKFYFADGSKGEDGKEKPLETLLTTFFSDF